MEPPSARPPASAATAGVASANGAAAAPPAAPGQGLTSPAATAVSAAGPAAEAGTSAATELLEAEALRQERRLTQRAAVRLAATGVRVPAQPFAAAPAQAEAAARAEESPWVAAAAAAAAEAAAAQGPTPVAVVGASLAALEGSGDRLQALLEQEYGERLQSFEGARAGLDSLRRGIEGALAGEDGSWYLEALHLAQVWSKRLPMGGFHREEMPLVVGNLSRDANATVARPPRVFQNICRQNL